MSSSQPEKPNRRIPLVLLLSLALGWGCGPEANPVAAPEVSPAGSTGGSTATPVAPAPADPAGTSAAGGGDPPDGNAQSAPPPIDAPVASADKIPIPRVTAPIQIDGKPDEPAWKNAAHVVLGPDGPSQAIQKTEISLLWDSQRLYLLARSEDADLVSGYTQRDQPLYLQDALELFLDPDGDQQDYMEFEVSPTGVLFDASFTGPRQGMDLGFNPQILVATQIDGTLNQSGDVDRAVVLELAIPFSAMTGRGRRPPLPADCWRGNLYRVDLSNSQQTLSAWRSTSGDFHDLSTYGSLCFGDGVRP
jgi:hypothetical protein